jgi:hypothetical protein
VMAGWVITGPYGEAMHRRHHVQQLRTVLARPETTGQITAVQGTAAAQLIHSV